MKKLLKRIDKLLFGEVLATQCRLMTYKVREKPNRSVVEHNHSLDKGENSEIILKVKRFLDRMGYHKPS